MSPTFHRACNATAHAAKKRVAGLLGHVKLGRRNFTQKIGSVPLDLPSCFGRRRREGTDSGHISVAWEA